MSSILLMKRCGARICSRRNGTKTLQQDPLLRLTPVCLPYRSHNLRSGVENQCRRSAGAAVWNTELF
jgi:hypothetical protein